MACYSVLAAGTVAAAVSALGLSSGGVGRVVEQSLSQLVSTTCWGTLFLSVSLWLCLCSRRSRYLVALSLVFSFALSVGSPSLTLITFSPPIYTLCLSLSAVCLHLLCLHVSAPLFLCLLSTKRHHSFSSALLCSALPLLKDTCGVCESPDGSMVPLVVFC